jgi:hypothetical protein
MCAVKHDSRVSASWTRRDALRAGVGVAAAALLAACGGASATPSAPPAAKPTGAPATAASTPAAASSPGVASRPPTAPQPTSSSGDTGQDALAPFPTVPHKPISIPSDLPPPDNSIYTPPTNLTCSAFDSQEAAQVFLRAFPSDPSNLDPGKTGIACPNSPEPFDKNPVARS